MNSKENNNSKEKVVAKSQYLQMEKRFNSSNTNLQPHTKY